jgi:hypothetical protein
MAGGGPVISMFWCPRHTLFGSPVVIVGDRKRRPERVTAIAAAPEGP